jgi:hypothetical protein
MIKHFPIGNMFTISFLTWWGHMKKLLKSWNSDHAQSRLYLLESSIPLCKCSNKHFSIDSSWRSARDSHSRLSSTSISSSGSSELTTKPAGSLSTEHVVMVWWSILVRTGDMINCRISWIIYLGSLTVLWTILNLYEEKKNVSAETFRLINSNAITLILIGQLKKRTNSVLD